jgi:hypothetical protein
MLFDSSKIWPHYPTLIIVGFNLGYISVSELGTDKADQSSKQTKIKIQLPALPFFFIPGLYDLRKFAITHELH